MLGYDIATTLPLYLLFKNVSLQGMSFQIVWKI